MKKIIAVVFGLLIVSLLSAFTVMALTIVHVTICHRTGSQTNPYTFNDVSVHSVDDARGLNGHGDHAEDAWMPFIFDGVTYDGRNVDVFGTIIDNNCNLIIPPTNTPIPTNTEIPSATPSPTATATDTSTPTASATATETSTPTATPSFTPTDTATNTPSATSTKEPFPTPTGTLIPTNTPTATNVPTSTPTDEPTSTPTDDPTFTATVNPTPTETPRPPVPAEANTMTEYKGKLLGTIYMDGNSYELYQGVNAPNGTLALPSNKRGAALFDNTIWVHRAWNSGWLNLKVGDTVIVLQNGKFNSYKIVISEPIPYGYYPKDNNLHIATCMSTNGVNWTNVELFTLQLINLEK